MGDKGLSKTLNKGGTKTKAHSESTAKPRDKNGGWAK